MLSDSVQLNPSQTATLLIKDTHSKKHLEKAYSETMPYFTGSPLHDHNFILNSHILNEDFSTNPKYILGYRTNLEDGIFLVACLYVFPEYRNKKIGYNLINDIKENIPVAKGVIIQLCISENQKDILHPYYESQGFTTTGIENREGLIDYFWWNKKLNLSMAHDNSKVLVERVY